VPEPGAAPTPAELEAIAATTARSAAELVTATYGRPDPVGHKSSPTDVVTQTDLRTEELIRRHLREATPDAGVLGEEGETTKPGARVQWVIDPLDGTVNFLYGLRAWAVSIALEDQDGLAAGVVFNPVSGECFSAVRGEGASVNGKPLRVTQCPTLDRAMVATGFSYEAERRREQAQLLVELLPRIRDLRRAGAAALDLAFVAAGRVDAFYERGLKRWDEAAGRLLVQEAGGVTADLEGEPHGVVAAATPPLLDELKAVVA
jgi:myo-inositol-1(or 4)-monophosphatase